MKNQEKLCPIISGRWTVPTTELPHQSIMHPVTAPPLHLPLLPSASTLFANYTVRGISIHVLSWWLLLKAKHVHWCLTTAWWLTLPCPQSKAWIERIPLHHWVKLSPAHHTHRSSDCQDERNLGCAGTNLWESHDRTGRSPDGLRRPGKARWQWWPPKTVQAAVTRAELPGPDPA